MADKRQANEYGYRRSRLADSTSSATSISPISAGPAAAHTMPVDAFLRALMRDVSWNFFYGVVNFDQVFGTTNHYGNVDVFAGLYNAGYRNQNKHYVETFKSDQVRAAVRGDARRLDQRGLRSFCRARRDRHAVRSQARQQSRRDHAQAAGREADGRD